MLIDRLIDMLINRWIDDRKMYIYTEASEEPSGLGVERTHDKQIRIDKKIDREIDRWMDVRKVYLKLQRNCLSAWTRRSCVNSWHSTKCLRTSRLNS